MLRVNYSFVSEADSSALAAAPVAGQVPGQFSHFSVHSAPAEVQCGQAAALVDTVSVEALFSQQLQLDFSPVDTVAVFSEQHAPPSLQQLDFALVATATPSLQQLPLTATADDSLQQLPVWQAEPVAHIALDFTSATESPQQLPVVAVTPVTSLISFNAAFSRTRL